MYSTFYQPRNGLTLCTVWLASVERRRCSDKAKTRKPLKLAGVPKTTGSISAASIGRCSPYCEDMWRRYRCLTSFFPIVDMCLSCEDIARQSYAMMPRRRLLAIFLRPAFPASHMQYITDLHSKFALRSHNVWKYGRHPISDR